MNIDDAFPSAYLKSSDFPAPVLWTMRKIEIESIGDDDERKPVLYFQEGGDQGLVLNKTNANRSSITSGQTLLSGWVIR